MIQWIVDASASDHMTSNINLIRLFQLNPSLTICNCLFVTDFKHNLLHVSNITSSKHLLANFFSTHYQLQDHSTKVNVAEGQGYNGLLTLEASSSFVNVNSNLPLSLHVTTITDLNLLHSSLGHTSLSKMKHITHCNSKM